MENKIRVDSGIVIEVNDKGETITVSTENQRFIDDFMELNEKLEDVVKEVESREVKQLEGREQLQFQMEKTKQIMEMIDALFGRDACRKVFGDIIPTPYLIADFFGQLTPIVKQYADERQKKIAEKYNRRRKGGSSRKRRNYVEHIAG